MTPPLSAEQAALQWMINELNEWEAGRGEIVYRGGALTLRLNYISSRKQSYCPAAVKHDSTYIRTHVGRSSVDFVLYSGGECSQAVPRARVRNSTISLALFGPTFSSARTETPPSPPGLRLGSVTSNPINHTTNRRRRRQHPCIRGKSTRLDRY